MNSGRDWFFLTRVSLVAVVDFADLGLYFIEEKILGGHTSH